MIARLLLVATLAVALAVSPALVHAQDPVTLSARCDLPPPGLEPLTAALDVELAAWSMLAVDPHCQPVALTLSACDEGDAPNVLVARAAEEEARAELAVDLTSADGVRTAALTAAELVERVYARCTASPLAAHTRPPQSSTQSTPPFRDTRPLATEADRALYYDHYALPRMLKRPAPGTVLSRARVGGFFESGGGGLVGETTLMAWLAEGFFLRAELGPAALVGSANGGIGQLSGALVLGYDTGAFAIGVGGGVGLANGPDLAGGELIGRADLFLRAFVEPIVYATLAANLGFSELGVVAGGIQARLAFALDPTWVITVGAEAALAWATGRVEAGVQAWLDGSIAREDGVAIELGVFGQGVGFVPRCSFGPCEDGRTLVLGPGLYAGVLVREGP